MDPSDFTAPSNGSHNSMLGQRVEYPQIYDPSLLFAIARAPARDALGLSPDDLPFVGTDRWHAYELSWLDARGKPVVATATLTVPADSPCLIESKSLKLYLNSLNAARFDDAQSVRARIEDDLSRAAEARVGVAFGLPQIARDDTVQSIDALDTVIDDYGPPNPVYLRCDGDEAVEESLQSQLLKSNCPVTGQPDWASVRIAYRGARIEREGLLRYLVSFRDHAEFHEQCVERIFIDTMARCRPDALCVAARYTRRGGLDINPSRATAGWPLPEDGRDARQ